MPVAKHSGGGTPRLTDIPTTPRTWGPSVGLLIGSLAYALAVVGPLSLPTMLLVVSLAVAAILLSLDALDEMLRGVNDAS